MADTIHNQWLRQIAVAADNRHDNQNCMTIFVKKRRIFCNSVNRCCFANLGKSLRKKNIVIITNGYIYLSTKISIGTAIA